jgi:MFS family permease
MNPPGVLRRAPHFHREGGQMNIERSFVFAFKAPGGIAKLLLGGLFSVLFFTVFFGFVVMGYLMRVLCDALEGRDAKLPSWGEIGSLFNEGLQPVLIIVAYCSPLIALLVVEQILNAILGWSFGVIAVFMALRFVIGIAISIAMPAALIRFAIKGRIRAAFDFGEILGFIKKNPGTYFTAWGLALVVGVVAGLVAMLLGGIVFGVAVAAGGLSSPVIFTGLGALLVASFFTAFASYLISMHLYAQAYRASTPFEDDKDGVLRASMAIPPPLK